MGAYLFTFKFDGVPPTAETFRARYAELYSPRCLDTYEVEGEKVSITCVFDPCGPHYIEAAMRGLGATAIDANDKPLWVEPPAFTSTPWRKVPIFTKLRVYFNWLRGAPGD